MTQREAFEAWLCPYDDDAMKHMTLERRGDGNYAQALPRLQWKVWQAATRHAADLALDAPVKTSRQESREACANWILGGME